MAEWGDASSGPQQSDESSAPTAGKSSMVCDAEVDDFWALPQGLLNEGDDGESPEPSEGSTTCCELRCCDEEARPTGMASVVGSFDEAEAMPCQCWPTDPYWHGGAEVYLSEGAMWEGNCGTQGWGYAPMAGGSDPFAGEGAVFAEDDYAWQAWEGYAGGMVSEANAGGFAGIAPLSISA